MTTRIISCGGYKESIRNAAFRKQWEIYPAASSTKASDTQPYREQNEESESLEVGKRGDVLLLEADPMADLHIARKVLRTVSAGAVYTASLLWEVLGSDRGSKDRSNKRGSRQSRSR